MATRKWLAGGELDTIELETAKKHEQGTAGKDDLEVNKPMTAGGCEPETTGLKTADGDEMEIDG